MSILRITTEISQRKKSLAKYSGQPISSYELPFLAGGEFTRSLLHKSETGQVRYRRCSAAIAVTLAGDYLLTCSFFLQISAEQSMRLWCRGGRGG
jgi:hypothetical protein